MDLEKERLHISQLDFELKDLRQQMGLKNQELDRMMAEKMKLNFELKETNRDRLDILTKQEKDLVSFLFSNNKIRSLSIIPRDMKSNP